MKTLRKIDSMLARVEQVLLSGLMGFLVVIVLTQVCLRYLFSSSLLWSEEGARFAFVWCVFLGTSVGVYRGSHIAVEFFAEKLGKRAGGHGNIRKAVLLCSAVYFAFFFALGVAFSRTNWIAKSAVLGLPMGLVYLVLPLASTFAFVHCLARALVNENRNA